MPESPEPPPQSSDALFGQAYERLKLMAGRQFASGARSVTLDTTVLVHELYLRIHAQSDLAFAYPGQFFSYAARAMRHLLTVGRGIINFVSDSCPRRRCTSCTIEVCASDAILADGFELP